MVNLITTDSYFNIFPILLNNLKEKGLGLSGRNVIFCEEKVSLMVERLICYETGGSFNTDVYSFGNFLRFKKQFTNLLSKEGSAMAVKRILATLSLKSFKSNKVNLAATLYELIMQLKSAKITPEEVSFASEKASGVLKDKLIDISTVYSGYEKFVADNGFEDQSSALSYLPEIIKNSDEIGRANVFIVGFTSFTAQAREVIKELIEKAASVTAILSAGDNPLVFLNETSNFIKTHCSACGVTVLEKRIDSDYTAEGKIILDNIFNPAVNKNSVLKLKEPKVYFNAAENPYQEVQRIAEIIKGAVINGDCRYRDITVALPDISSYGEIIKSVFNTLSVPYFIDERKKPLNHPLITLIKAYTECFKKFFERKAVIAFIKNPLVCADKTLADKFENYVIKYNVNYGRFKEKFNFEDSESDLVALNSLRETLIAVCKNFDVKGMLLSLNVKEKLDAFTIELDGLNRKEDAAVNSQIFDAVTNVLNEMDLMLNLNTLSVTDFKAVFNIGVSALELSIIPQYNDAVFIGGYKECALAKAKYLFAPALTADVPAVQADIALLTDSDIDALENMKLLLEPKIRVVNHRARESTALALSAFSERLYLSYPVSGVDGKKLIKSEILTEISGALSLAPFPKAQDYLTLNQGANSFAKTCGEIIEREAEDFTIASSFYQAVAELGDKDLADDILKRANKEFKIKLDGDIEVSLSEVTSPTAIEDYFKCPYRAFLAHSIKLNAREEGAVNVLSVGNLMHEIFKLYVLKIDEITDKESSDRVFNEIALSVLEREEYKKYLLDSVSAATVKRVLLECNKYCFNTYKSLKNSQFTQVKTEVPFGDGKEYPAIPLLNGKVKIKGKIDRLDESESYFRVLDYKTGSVDTTDKSLFAGVKLQLYLYALAVQQKLKEKGKKPAGLYYLPVSDKFEKPEDKIKAMAYGKTLDETDALVAQDESYESNGVSEFLPVYKDKNGVNKHALKEDGLNACIDYALKVSELAAKRMSEGVIVASPYLGACRYCEFKGLCDYTSVKERSLKKVDETVIQKAVKGEDENA